MIGASHRVDWLVLGGCVKNTGGVWAVFLRCWYWRMGDWHNVGAKNRPILALVTQVWWGSVSVGSKV